MRNWVWLRNEGSEGPGRASSRRVELPNSDPAPQVWRAPEGPEGLAAVPVGGGGAWSRCRWVAAGPGRASRSTTPSRQARVWRSRGRAAAHRHTERPDRTRQIMRSGWRARRAELAARTARGRAAAHGHTERPDRTRQIMRSGRRVGRRPRAHKVARPNKTEDPATGSLATRAAAEQCTGCTAIETAADQRKTPAQPPAFTASQQHSQKSYEKYESFIGSS